MSYQVKEQLIESEYVKPEVRCVSSNKIQTFCINPNCRFPSLICRQETCLVCASNHQQCSFRQFSRLTSKIEKKLAFSKKTFSDFISIENRLIQDIVSSRKQINDRNYIFKIDDKLNKFCQQIQQGKGKQLFAQEMNDLFLSLSLNQVEDRAKLYLGKYKQQTQKLLRNLVDYREDCLQIIFKLGQKSKQQSANIQRKPSSQNQKNQISENVEPPPPNQLQPAQRNSEQQKRVLKSQIIKQEDKQKIDYLYEQLNNPSQLKLLFRASQHNFEASQFHYYCNNVPHTVTIIQTEFNKTIAAYTSQEWISRNYYHPDHSGYSFLLQLDLLQKMELVKKSKAIYDSPKNGPCFGIGDITISNKCHQNQQSYCEFPAAYNSSSAKKYKRGQQESKMALSGVSQGRNLKILNYEVFSISW